jgi:hypothetical protein
MLTILGVPSLLRDLLLLQVDMLKGLGVHLLLMTPLLLVVDVLKFLVVPSLLEPLLMPMDMLGILGVLSVLLSLLLLLPLVDMLRFLGVAEMQLSVLGWLLSSTPYGLLALSLAVYHLHHSGCRRLSQALQLSSACLPPAGQLPL